MAKYEFLKIEEVKPFVYSVQLNRPQKMNALNKALWMLEHRDSISYLSFYNVKQYLGYNNLNTTMDQNFSDTYIKTYNTCIQNRFTYFVQGYTYRNKF